jgi:hypothetical protein
VTVAAARAYSVPAAGRRTVQLPLTAPARRVLRTRRALRVRVTLDPGDGTSVNRVLTLTR